MLRLEIALKLNDQSLPPYFFSFAQLVGESKLKGQVVEIVYSADAPLKGLGGLHIYLKVDVESLFYLSLKTGTIAQGVELPSIG